VAYKPQEMRKILPAPYRKVLDVIDLATAEGRDVNAAIMEAVN
jgi:glutamate synthase (NADPH/NADH) large chain